MDEDLDSRADWIEKMMSVRNNLAHIPYAARHQREITLVTAEEIEAAYQAGQLPAGLAELWASHRVEINTALHHAQTFADGWDELYPVLKTRPVGE